MTTNDSNTGRALLLEILGWARPHESECEIRFAREYLDTIPGMEADAFGNRFLQIGDTNVAWSAHIDTVARHGGPQALKVAKDGTISLKDKKKKCSLGADDGTGVWIMLEMIRHGRPGRYLFHRGEERGCLGSRWIVENTPERLAGIDVCMAFDRAGFQDVITHQASGKTASDEFALSFAEQLNAVRDFEFRPDDTGVYTDTNEYAGLVAECSNLSVGYHHQHSKDETQSLYFAEALLDALLRLDVSKLVVARSPGDFGDFGLTWTRSASKRFRASMGRRTPNALDELADIVSDQPHAVAAILARMGYDARELWAECLEEMDADDLDRRAMEGLELAHCYGLDARTEELARRLDDYALDSRWEDAA
jgi:hypothetical protein